MFNITFTRKPIELNLEETLALLSGYNSVYNASDNIYISINNSINPKFVSFYVLCLSSNNATKANQIYNSTNYFNIAGNTLQN